MSGFLERLDPHAPKSKVVATPLDPLTPLHRVLAHPAGERLGGADLVARLRLEGAALIAALYVAKGGRNACRPECVSV